MLKWILQWKQREGWEGNHPWEAEFREEGNWFHSKKQWWQIHGRGLRCLLTWRRVLQPEEDFIHHWRSIGLNGSYSIPRFKLVTLHFRAQSLHLWSKANSIVKVILHVNLLFHHWCSINVTNCHTFLIGKKNTRMKSESSSFMHFPWVDIYISLKSNRLSVLFKSLVMKTEIISCLTLLSSLIQK